MATYLSQVHLDLVKTLEVSHHHVAVESRPSDSNPGKRVGKRERVYHGSCEETFTLSATPLSISEESMTMQSTNITGAEGRHMLSSDALFRATMDAGHC